MNHKEHIIDMVWLHWKPNARCLVINLDEFLKLTSATELHDNITVIGRYRRVNFEYQYRDTFGKYIFRPTDKDKPIPLGIEDIVLEIIP
jgi:hypothetical protein